MLNATDYVTLVNVVSEGVPLLKLTMEVIFVPVANMVVEHGVPPGHQLRPPESTHMHYV